VRPEVLSDTEEENSEPGLLQRFASEAIGTFFLVLTAISVIYSDDLMGVWPIAAAVTCLIYSLGSVSGGHFNPCVTLALRLRGISVPYIALYPAAQVLGGILAACMARGLYPAAMAKNSTWYGRSVQLDGAWMKACSAEVTFTFLLCFVVLCIATVDGKDLRDVAAFTVGSCVTAGGTAVGRMSGGHFNPAVTSALMFANQAFHKEQDGNHSPNWFCPLMWILSQMIGATVAVLCFKVAYPSKLPEEQSLLASSEKDDLGYAAAKLASIPPAAAQPEAEVAVQSSGKPTAGSSEEP